MILGVLLVFGASAYFTLTLIIKGEDTVVVPELTGKEVVYALEVLTDLGLNTKVRGFEYSDTIPKNHIIYQQPEPGAEIKKDRDVHVIISKGASVIAMPNLRGLPLPQVHIILEENGLCQGWVSSSYNPSFRKDEIIAQTPRAGDSIKRGECVDLLVSLGMRPTPHVMPQLTGLALDDAIIAIEKNNLVLGEIKSEYLAEKLQNRVLDQEPLSGYLVSQGSAVSLTINRKPGNGKKRSLQASSGVRLFRHRLESGFLKRHIVVRVDIFGVSNDLFDAFMAPGEELWLLIPANRFSTVFLYEDEKLIRTQVFDG